VLVARRWAPRPVGTDNLGGTTNKDEP